MNEIIKKALKWMRDTAADDTHGYDQTHRNGPNYDCSSAVITAYKSAGVDTGEPTPVTCTKILNGTDLQMLHRP